MTDKLIPVPIENEMKQSYLAYAMSVIVSRALPDVRDGLKPVHRRILYSMREQGYTPDKPFRKSAATVGEVLKSYHPHGDQSVYDAMVRMAQPFNMRYTLIDGHGNFGSVDGDPAAAMRYTESRLSKIAMELLEDLDKDTVDFADNFDNTQKEPTVLPAKLPNLLLNGSTGIAVGMATNIPPHNLGELIDGITRLIDEPTVPDEVLLGLIPAPDFPTGGLILGTRGARQAYLTGRGAVTVRSRHEIEEVKGSKVGKVAIVVTEIPYQVNKVRLIEQIAQLVKDKKIDGITDLRDESDRKGMRIVIELRVDAIPKVVLNQLYKHTSLQVNFGINNLALVDNEPKTLSLRECLEHYLKHRLEVVRRRSQYLLNKALRRAHIVEGLLKALDHLDEIIALIRASATTEEARTGLMGRFGFSEEQANAILDLRLQRLVGLERNRLAEEYAELQKTIAYLQGLLASEGAMLGVIKDELHDIRARYNDKRKSEIIPDESGDLRKEDLITPQDVFITLSAGGYIKRLPVDTYRAQNRGGKGVLGAKLKEDDFLEHILVANTHHHLLFITTRGRAFSLRGFDVPEASKTAKGTLLKSLLQLQDSEDQSLREKVLAIHSLPAFAEGEYAFMATRRGMVKKTALANFKSIKANGKIALTMKDEDELVSVRVVSGTQSVLMITRDGMSIRFSHDKVSPTGTGSMGVHGMKLDEAKGDEVVSMEVVGDEGYILVVTEKGYGKRSALSLYKKQGRNGLGTITFKSSDKTKPTEDAESGHQDESANLGKKERGKLVAARLVLETDDIIIASNNKYWTLNFLHIINS